MKSIIEILFSNIFYLSLALYIAILIIILYCFDHSNNITINHHIKFFIYSYIVFLLFNFYNVEYYENNIKKKYVLRPEDISINEMMDNKK